MMVSLEECVRVTGLSKSQLVLGASPSTRHLSLLSSYLIGVDHGVDRVRQRIVSDLHSFVDLGAQERAADALIVLRMFLFQYPPPAASAGPSQEGSTLCRDASDRIAVGVRRMGGTRHGLARLQVIASRGE